MANAADILGKDNKCPTCHATGDKSWLFEGKTRTQIVAWQPYFDEDGQRHLHNPNAHALELRCSKGHHWELTYYMRCPCGYIENDSSARRVDQS